MRTFRRVCFYPSAVVYLLSVRLRALQMSLIFSAGSLADVHPPCVLQSFVNHGAVLHKVFVVGDRHFCVERPSLKNFPSGPCGQSAPDQLKYKIYTLYTLYTIKQGYAKICYATLFFFALFVVSTLTVIYICLQTGRPSSSTAIRCPSQSPVLISQQ